MGLGLPALFNDHEFVPVLLEWGATPEEAWRYGIVGCVEPAVMGVVHGQTMGGHINLLKCLELAMNDGRALMSGAQVGPRTGEFEDFQSYEQLMDAYQIQLEWAIKLNCEAVDAAGHSQQKLFGYPFMSATMQGAIAQGRDLVDGARINRATVCMVGMTNVVDALIAVEALVFEGGKIGKGDLMEALRRDFSGFEALEALLLTGAPKFGNGEDGPVRLYNRLSEMQQRAFDRYTGPRGDRYNSGLWATTWHVTMGASTGASADGRRAGMPLVDGIGAVTGRATQGPTSVAVDVAKLEARKHWQGGYTFNMKFTKTLLEKEKGLLSFRDYLNTFFELGGMQMQINTISRELLLAAQREPEKHADLIVRVAGFSAYFIGLSRSVQDEIISRTEHAV
jgi:formate C-acetyltransferase